MIKNVAQKAFINHYLVQSNPFKSQDQLKLFVNNNCIYESNDLVAYNKPPQMKLRNSISCTQNDNNQADLIRELIKQKFKWDKIYQYSLITNDASGICLFTNSLEKKKEVDQLARFIYTSNNIVFLKYYAITTLIPLNKIDKEIFNTRKILFNDKIELLQEDKEPSKKQMKADNIKTHHIEHNVIDYNEDLNVALVEFNTTLNVNDGLQLYCIKHLSPILGDHKYSIFIRKSKLTNQAFSMLNAYNNYEFKNQDLTDNVLNALGLNSYLVDKVPLHLHLKQINFTEKFKKKRLQLSIDAPFQSYFDETLKRLNLNFK